MWRLPFPAQSSGEPKFDSDYTLICPKCGGNNLHHSRVHCYTRDEDAVTGVHADVQIRMGSAVQVDSDMRNNPSARRSGVRIEFFCETCPSDKRYPGPILRIIQHKGCTYVTWETEEP